MTYHPALTKVDEIFKKARRHTLKYQRLTAVLPSSARLAFRNSKTLKDHLVRSKLKTAYEKLGVTICGRKNCEICHILRQGDNLKVRILEKSIRLTFHLIVRAEMLFSC